MTKCNERHLLKYRTSLWRTKSFSLNTKSLARTQRRLRPLPMSIFKESFQLRILKLTEESRSWSKQCKFLRTLKSLRRQRSMRACSTACLMSTDSYIDTLHSTWPRLPSYLELSSRTICSIEFCKILLLNLCLKHSEETTEDKNSESLLSRASLTCCRSSPSSWRISIKSDKAFRTQSHKWWLISSVCTRKWSRNRLTVARLQPTLS